MKIKISAVLFMFVLMALTPFIATKCNSSNVKQALSSTADTPQKANNNDDYGKTLCALTAYEYKQSYCTETIKAIAIIMNTNYKLNPKSFKKDMFIYKENTSGNILEAYSEIEKAVNSVKEKTLCKNSKAFYIPFSETSNGFTCKNKQYSYLTQVASVWDCYSKEYNEKINCFGVSLSGVDYLCKNGYNAQEALKWYLPDFEVTEIKG